MRLSRRRGPSAQLASSPRAARSTSEPKRTRMCSSRRWRIVELSSPYQKVIRRLNPSADRGSLPNQKSRTLRASSMGRGRVRAGLVGFEQPLELLRGSERGCAEFFLVLLDRVLSQERLLIVLAEAAHHFARARRSLPERLENRGGVLQARRVGLANDLRNSRIHERERMLAIAGARKDGQLRELLAHERRGAYRGIDVIDRQHEHARVLRTGRTQQIEPRGVTVVDLVAEASHEIDVGLTAVERGERQSLHPQNTRHDL